MTREGFLVGALCVIDSTPRKLTNMQWHGLKVLGKAVMWRIEGSGLPEVRAPDGPR
jgi:hypothetical protein